MSWLRRYLQRQDDLARGVDADLVRANRRRFRLALALLCLAFLVVWTTQKLALGHALHSAATAIALLLAFAGVVLFWWSWREQIFLRKPDPEPPPSIFND